MKSKHSDLAHFNKEFTRQESIPEEGIRRAVELMQSGRLHRYNTALGEASEVALLEKEYAAYVKSRFCAAFNSCGSSIQFNVEGVPMSRVALFVEECGRRGVEIKWFGQEEPVGYTSSYESW